MLSSKIYSKIKEHKLFKFLVILAILLSSLNVGASTFELKGFITSFFKYLDLIITLFFLFEIIIRFIAESDKKKFFKDGWNIFDTILVTVSIIPIGPGTSILLLRLIRIFRILRLITAVPELKLLIEALLASMKKAAYIFLFLFIILYIYGAFGSLLFSEIDPERWKDIGVSMRTLFQVLTLSSWETVFLPLQKIYWWAWIYFFSFICIGSITILNLVVAVLVDFMVNKDK